MCPKRNSRWAIVRIVVFFSGFSSLQISYATFAACQIILNDYSVSFSSEQFTVKPKRGDALLFFSLFPNAIPDTRSLHAGCPVLEGEKWSATKWIHVDSFDTVVGGECSDQNENCEKWANLGECTSNPEYMVGSPALPGYCMKSCKAC